MGEKIPARWRALVLFSVGYRIILIANDKCSCEIFAQSCHGKPSFLFCIANRAHFFASHNWLRYSFTTSKL